MPVREHKASDYLKTPEDIAAYLNVVFEDSDTDHEDLMIALRNVADAIGGVCGTGAPNRPEPIGPVPCALGAEYPED